MIDKLKNIFWKAEGMDYKDNPSDTIGTFKLKFEKQLIGILTYEEDQWKFQYSDEFKKNKRITPIIDFPDLDKIYTNNQLWPFFATRIPSLNQPFQLKKVKRANIDKDNPVELLKLFGSDTITNPYRLLPV